MKNDKEGVRGNLGSLVIYCSEYARESSVKF